MLLRNYRRVLLSAASLFAGLSLLAILLFDGRIALALTGVSSDALRIIHGAVHVCEVLFAFPITPYLYGLVLIVTGATSRWVSRRPFLAEALFFVGLSHVTGRFLVDILKPLFSRLRPFETIVNGAWRDVWFTGVGNSFPSGHAVHFWSLFFPLMVLFPRQTIPLAILPVFMSVARVAVNAHYVGDVLASAAVAALVTWAYAAIVLKGGKRR